MDSIIFSELLRLEYLDYLIITKYTFTKSKISYTKYKPVLFRRNLLQRKNTTFVLQFYICNVCTGCVEKNFTVSFSIYLVAV